METFSGIALNLFTTLGRIREPICYSYSVFLSRKDDCLHLFSLICFRKVFLTSYTLFVELNCGRFLEMGIPEHLTCLLRNLYAGQEATVRTGHRTTDWFQIGKGVHQGCMLSSCLFNLYTEYIMRNAELDKAQAGIKIAGRNNNNLRYADDTTLIPENEEELKSLLIKVRVKKLA